MTDLDQIQLTLQGTLGSVPNITALATQLRQILRRRKFFLQDTDAATAATAVGEYEVFKADVPCQLLSAYAVVGIAVTAGDTNYATFQLFKRAAALYTSQLGCASINTAITVAPFSGNLVADTPQPLTLNATAANQAMVAGDVLTHALAKVGTGLAMTAALTAKGGKYQVGFVIEEL